MKRTSMQENQAYNFEHNGQVYHADRYYPGDARWYYIVRNIAGETIGIANNLREVEALIEAQREPEPSVNDDDFKGRPAQPEKGWAYPPSLYLRGLRQLEYAEAQLTLRAQPDMLHWLVNDAAEHGMIYRAANGRVYEAWSETDWWAHGSFAYTWNFEITSPEGEKIRKYSADEPEWVVAEMLRYAPASAWKPNHPAYRPLTVATMDEAAGQSLFHRMDGDPDRYERMALEREWDEQDEEARYDAWLAEQEARYDAWLAEQEAREWAMIDAEHDGEDYF